MINALAEHDPEDDLEIAGLEVEQAQALHARLGKLRNRLNVYRGHVLDAILHPMSRGVLLGFGDVLDTVREDVVLPESVLAAVERHALGVAHPSRALDDLLDNPQELTRNLLGWAMTPTTRLGASPPGRFHRWAGTAG